MTAASQHQGPASLRADCGACSGLCCTAPAFSASADFAISKPAGRPCQHLGPDFRCGIHTELRGRGFAGCAVYDCFGAGQKVTQSTYGGRDWRSAPRAAPQMFAVFGVMRQLHELLWHLAQARELPAAGPLRADLDRACRDTEDLTWLAPAALLELDVAAHRDRANALLLRASELARAGAGPRPDHRGASLAGAGLRGARLAGASLRGACLVGADLREADLTGADFTGADLRGADLRGATLSGALFLTQPQLEAARGDGATVVPEPLTRPGHWPGRAGPARPARTPKGGRKNG